jgi:Mce-associated membrane protein
VLVAGIACLTACVAAVWFGVGWARAAYFTDMPRAAAREAALDGARQVGLNLTTVNPDDPDSSLKLIESSVTGDLLDHVTGTAEEYEQTVRQADTVVSSKVLAASLTQLNSERNKASAVVVLEETETPKDGRQAQVQQFTWAIDMSKTGAGWKAEQATPLGEPVLLGVPGNLYNARGQAGAATDTSAPHGGQPATPTPPTTKPGS